MLFAGRHLHAIVNSLRSVQREFEACREVAAVLRQIRVHGIATAAKLCFVTYGR
jgi:hypothetical protein